MHPRLGRPPSELLSIKVAWDGKETPQRCQTHVQHDRFHKPALFDPRGDELAEAVSPDILIDGDGHENRTRDGLVAVDGVGADDGWESGNLNSSGRVADDDNHLGPN